MFFEVSHEVLGFMYKAKLENDVVIYAFDDGTALGNDSNKYRVVTHLNEDDEVVTDGCEKTE